MTNHPWLPLLDPALLARTIRIPVDPATLIYVPRRGGKSAALAIAALQYLQQHEHDEDSSS